MNRKTEELRTGYFGDYGGQYIPEMIMPALRQLEAEYEAAARDPEFQDRYERYPPLHQIDFHPTSAIIPSLLAIQSGIARKTLLLEWVPTG